MPWRRWGPYVSARQWGTVREDYSEHGDAWDHLTHDQARSRAYRWGEDGIAGICDDQQRLCLSLALWNGRDPILKERLFGLTNSEGNHGEDAKEYWFHLHNTPTHSSMSCLYKYPQREFPYADLTATSAARGRGEFEYELLETGVFDDSAYWDVVVDYAKDSPEDIVMRVTAHNRGSEEATLHLLPTLWFRNTWSWSDAGDVTVPVLVEEPGYTEVSVVRVDHPELGARRLLCEGAPPLLFTDNETNTERLSGRPNTTPYVKDGIDRYVVHGETAAVNPAARGTKVAAHYQLTVPAGDSSSVTVRLTDSTPTVLERDGLGEGTFAAQADVVLARRAVEADEFYDEVLAPTMSTEDREVVRAALAGMLWSKQYYGYDVQDWIHQRGGSAPRNGEWQHLRAHDVISMPDTWEYPWFAAWDLAFHCIPLSMVDPAFAKQQLELLLSRRYLHPNGQIPAYEWNFSDVNPPVHAWATYFVYDQERRQTGTGDLAWLENQFQKLAKNFTWWVNRKDVDGNNVYQGGFLGLDNIGVFDRSAPLPTGGHLDQADGTAWMALYCQNMVQIAVTLSAHNPVYAEHAATFMEQFIGIALAVHGGSGGTSMWDEEDGFFYDLLRRPDGSAVQLKVRSDVGLLPLAAATVIPGEIDTAYPELIGDLRSFLRRRLSFSTMPPPQPNAEGDHLLALFDEDQLRRILARMLDESEFLGPHGIRSVSKVHEREPYVFGVDGQDYRVTYAPAESDSGMFGGNSNWRGPVWFPINAMLIRALLNLYVFYGDDLTVECPTGSGHQATLYEVAEEISRRLTSTFQRGPDGHRPVYGGQRLFQEDPHWRDLLLFFEYFHGDNGAGLGASHQTGWTGLVAVFPQLFALASPELLREAPARRREVGRPAAPAGTAP